MTSIFLRGDEGGGKGFCDKYNINFTLYYQFELGDPPLT